MSIATARTVEDVIPEQPFMENWPDELVIERVDGKVCEPMTRGENHNALCDARSPSRLSRRRLMGNELSRFLSPKLQPPQACRLYHHRQRPLPQPQQSLQLHPLVTYTMRLVLQLVVVVLL